MGLRNENPPALQGILAGVDVMRFKRMVPIGEKLPRDGSLRPLSCERRDGCQRDRQEKLHI